jgi:hypothetical protein
MHAPGFPPGVHLKGGRNAAPVHAQAAREFYAPLIPIVVKLQGQGLSLRAIARELDRQGIKPRYGCRAGWNAAGVHRVLARAAQPPCAGVAAVAPLAAPMLAAVADMHLVVNGQRRGPFTDRQVRAMVDAGTLTLETVLFWRDGATGMQWLKDVFGKPGA